MKETYTRMEVNQIILEITEGQYDLEDYHNKRIELS